MEASLLEPPRIPKAIGPSLPTLPPPKEVSRDQQEEDLIQKQIKTIKDSKASNRLYWSNMEEVY